MEYEVKETKEHYMIVQGNREIAKFVKTTGMKKLAERSCKRLNDKYGKRNN